MNKVISRLLIFFIGLPCVIGIILLPFFNHLAFNLLICVVTFFTSLELHSLISNKTPVHKKNLVIPLALLPSMTTLLYNTLSCFFDGMFLFKNEIITYIYILSLIVILSYEVFKSETFDESFHKISSSFFTITYAGFLITFLSRMTSWRIGDKSIAVPVLCIFSLMVFLCDSFAWFFGVLLGKNNRNVVKASPNKSLAGFLGGYFGSISAGYAAFLIWPDIFSGTSNAAVKLVVTGILIATSSIVGDLGESVLKRSCGVKDSGKIIPGRGGMLDSTDSIMISAPVFYIVFILFFGPFN